MIDLYNILKLYLIQQIIKGATRSKLDLHANVSCVNLYTFSSSYNCAPNKFSVLKHSFKLNKNIIRNIDVKLMINLIIMMLTSILIPFPPNCSKEFVAKNNTPAREPGISRFSGANVLATSTTDACDDICRSN